MRKLNLLIGLVVLTVFFTGCFEENGDKEKIVEMTIYAETGYGASVMSDILTEPLMFSDNDDNQKHLLVDMLTEGFDFEYEKGYEYVFKVKKVWMQEPPQDASSIKYIFIEQLSKTKVITENSEENIHLFVSSETVKFTPNYPPEYEDIGGIQCPKVYDALYAKEEGSNLWMALTGIEGFNFEAGYEYVLDVKKITQAEPYSVRYILLDVLSKNVKN